MKITDSGSRILIAGEPGHCGRLHPVPQPALDPQHLGAQQLQPQQGDARAKRTGNSKTPNTIAWIIIAINIFL